MLLGFKNYPVMMACTERGQGDFLILVSAASVFESRAPRKASSVISFAWRRFTTHPHSLKTDWENVFENVYFKQRLTWNKHSKTKKHLCYI